MVAAHQPSSEEEDLSPIIKVGRTMRQLGKNEWRVQYYFLKSVLYREKHPARGSGNRGGPWRFALRKEREGREGENPFGILVNFEL